MSIRRRSDSNRDTERTATGNFQDYCLAQLGLRRQNAVRWSRTRFHLERTGQQPGFAPQQIHTAKCTRRGSNPQFHRTQGLKPCAYANSATGAEQEKKGVEPLRTVLETVMLSLHHSPRSFCTDSNHNFRITRPEFCH